MVTLPANYWQITDDRYNRKATLLVSQLPTSDRYNVFQSELITEVCLERIVHKAMKFCLFGEGLRKSINFADNAEDYQRTERISLELVNRYRLEYALRRVGELGLSAMCENKMFITP